jgi:hypothetical protein
MGVYVTYVVLTEEAQGRYLPSGKKGLATKKCPSIFKLHRRRPVKNLLQVEMRPFQKIVDSQTPALLSTFPHMTTKGTVFSTAELSRAILGKKKVSERTIVLPNKEGFFEVLDPTATATLAKISLPVEGRMRERLFELFEADGDGDEVDYFLPLLIALAKEAVATNGAIFEWGQFFENMQFSISSFIEPTKR